MEQKSIIYRFKDFLKERFPFPVQKVPLHLYLGCPNKNAGNLFQGCIYCYSPGYSTIQHTIGQTIDEQIQSHLERSQKQGFSGKFIAYFQTETNTNAHVSILEKHWRTVEKYSNDFVGLAIGTRPDCLNHAVMELLADLSQHQMLWLELGLQSANDSTLQFIKRGHNFACFQNAVNRIKQYPQILICTHIILGLPGETIYDMLHTISELNALGIHGIKIHHLQIVKRTELANMHAVQPIRLFSEEEYINLLTEILLHLSPSICIHRLIGDIQTNLLIGPQWSMHKTVIIQKIYEKMKKENVYQGMYTTHTSHL